MQTLIIGSPELKAQFEKAMHSPIDAIWVSELKDAISQLDVVDIDAIVFDLRKDSRMSCAELKKLIARTSVTTRVLAIVERLPDEQIFSESGVVYLTPPVHFSDIEWFLKSGTELEN